MIKVLWDETVLAPLADGLSVIVTVVLTEPRLISDFADLDSFTDVETVPGLLTDILCVPSVIVRWPDLVVTVMVSAPPPVTLSFRRTDPDV